MDVEHMNALEHIADLNRKIASAEVDPSMFGQILDALPDGLIVINRRGQIHLVNVQIELMFGFHRSQLLGSPVHKLLDSSLADVHARHLQSFFRNPSARPMNLAKHLAGQHADGERIMVQISIGPLISEAGVFGLAIVRRVDP